MIKQLLAFLCLTVSVGANSLTLDVSGGQLLGATQVQVGDTFYDVQFLDGSCNSLFAGCSSFAFTTLAEADLASHALLDQVLRGHYDNSPELTNGIENFNVGLIFTPYGVSTSGQVLAAVVKNYRNNIAFDCVCIQPPPGLSEDFTLDFTYTYAAWSPAEVPIPAAAWLFASALGGLGALKSKKA